MKSKKLVVLFLALATAAMSFVAIYNVNSIVGNKGLPRNTALEGYYSLDMTFLSSTNKEVNTVNNNKIQFDVFEYGLLTFQGNSYFCNTTKIAGLHSLTINFVTSGIDLSISYGWAKKDYDVIDGIINSGSQTYTFNNESPSYFEIANNSGTPVQISSIEVEYSCHETELPSKYALTFIENSSKYYVNSCKAHAVHVVIPETYNGKPVVGVQGMGFANCGELISLHISKNFVENISGFNFIGCQSLSSITVHEDNPYYYTLDGILYKNKGEKILIKCPTTKEGNVIVESGTSEIWEYAFYSCSSISSISIPNSVTSLGTEAFYKCTSLSSVTIPGSVNFFGSGVFRCCSSIVSAVLENGISSIGDVLFYGCTSLESINIPSTILNIGESSFAGCTSLESINIPINVSTIGQAAFSGCVSLNSINIPDNINSIGMWAFDHCTSLGSIIIPVSVSVIGSYVFQDCINLTIYCEAESMPSGWAHNWNSSERPVVWGYSA